tara:strand:+ start:245 stop:505 length:261 start_codon:yes stop_codon:yes gene_type:complete
MDINDLIAIVKKKLQSKITVEKINVEDKSFLHKRHSGNKEGKFHIKVSLESKELKELSKVNRNRKIHKILDNEIKNYIHSLQIIIN